MVGNLIEDKTFDFAVRIVKLYRFLTDEKREFVLSNQLLRSGTSIGANVSEGEKAQSRADFYSKMSISLKEAYESYYSDQIAVQNRLSYGERICQLGN